MKKYFSFFILLFYCGVTFSQPDATRGWHLKDYTNDGYYGISLSQAYKFLAEKKIESTPVIVAILDDGIDTAHEDLQNVLWVNKKEISGNKKDDDGNGYADDVHGWNFLGSPQGKNVLANSSEWIRVYWRYKNLYEGKKIDTTVLSKEEKYTYTLWLKARSGVVGQGKTEPELQNLQQFLMNTLFCDSVLQPYFPNQTYTAASLTEWKPGTKRDKSIKDFFLHVFEQFLLPGADNYFVTGELSKYVSGEVKKANGDKAPPEDERRELTGDDEKSMQNIYYGNNNISDAPLMHGTHLAGIIAADRNNKIGMEGIANNVQVMMVRTSADGDELDKDIAAGIYYAVNNGAKIINMSFGKSLSPDKRFVDEAMKYAAGKDVLIIQAAGNSKRNIDGYDNFPNRKILFTDSLALNWITVGASDTLGNAADFSNYGEKVVDVFAPGVAIYSTVPGNKYMSWEGTSMAAPVVSGTAALLRSYFPKLTAAQVKIIIEKSVSIPAQLTTMPGTTEKVPFTKLCTSGGIVNAYKAVAAAYELEKNN